MRSMGDACAGAEKAYAGSANAKKHAETWTENRIRPAALPGTRSAPPPKPGTLRA